ncbi:MAG: tRNA uridine-5-carboxymethylaminomethyl(34) synthesis GTPase MnmE [Bacteroidota bacterium]|nr:tRNA uridine-5-carboxymethylaminomethyl(34) synthesis GTPase MnmE [Bacteroidota bacterium]
MLTSYKSDTIAAISTGEAVSAIGMIRLSGPKAIAITENIFKGAVLAEADSHTAHFGRIVYDDGTVLDEVVITVYKAPRSYTTEDVIEISCHGSPYILKEILTLLVKKGALPADPGEFTMRAFINGRMDLSQAEAVADLIESQSKASHRMAMHQMRGGVSNEIKTLRQKLLDFASLIELELDFGEEDVEFADRTQLSSLVNEILEMIRRLKNTFHLGNAIKEGIPTVIAGRPNAGKSTILNRLLNEERAIVSSIAGTTRDTIEEILTIEGVQFRIIDTAGIHEAHDEIELIGIQRTMEKIEQASVLVYVFDVTELYPSDVLRDIGAIQPGNAKIILAANKMDRNPYLNPEEYRIGDYGLVPLSALNNMNIEYLKETISQSVTSEIPSDIPMISSLRHYHALERTEERLGAVLEGFAAGTTHDFVAQDIRQALYHLGEITGQISTEDLLGNIFGRFCIGK